MKHFVDEYDFEVLDPATMNYDAVPAKSCRGCVFKRQKSDVCELACQLAVRVGKPHCEADEGWIYVLHGDPRQRDLTQE